MTSAPWLSRLGLGHGRHGVGSILNPHSGLSTLCLLRIFRVVRVPQAIPSLPQQLRFLRVVLPVEGFGEFGGGVGALGAVGEQGDVDELVFDAGAASVVAPKKNNTEPVVAGQPREVCSLPAVRLHVEPDRAVATLPT